MHSQWVSKTSKELQLRTSSVMCSKIIMSLYDRRTSCRWLSDVPSNGFKSFKVSLNQIGRVLLGRSSALTDARDPAARAVLLPRVAKKRLRHFLPFLLADLITRLRQLEHAPPA